MDGHSALVLAAQDLNSLHVFGDTPTYESKSTSRIEVENGRYSLSQSSLHLGHMTWTVPFRSVAPDSDLEGSEVMKEGPLRIVIGESDGSISG